VEVGECVDDGGCLECSSEIVDEWDLSVFDEWTEVLESSCVSDFDPSFDSVFVDFSDVFVCWESDGGGDGGEGEEFEPCG